MKNSVTKIDLIRSRFTEKWHENRNTARLMALKELKKPPHPMQRKELMLSVKGLASDLFGFFTHQQVYSSPQKSDRKLDNFDSAGFSSSSATC